MPSDESKGSQLDAIGSLAQRQLDNTEWVHWCNTQRLLEPIGNVAPVEHEMNYYRSQEGSLEMARLN